MSLLPFVQFYRLQAHRLQYEHAREAEPPTVLGAVHLRDGVQLRLLQDALGPREQLERSDVLDANGWQQGVRFPLFHRIGSTSLGVGETADLRSDTMQPLHLELVEDHEAALDRLVLLGDVQKRRHVLGEPCLLSKGRAVELRGEEQRERVDCVVLHSELDETLKVCPLHLRQLLHQLGQPNGLIHRPKWPPATARTRSQSADGAHMRAHPDRRWAKAHLGIFSSLGPLGPCV